MKTETPLEFLQILLRECQHISPKVIRLLITSHERFNGPVPIELLEHLELMGYDHFKQY
jgi:hypothetical protein